MFRQITTLCALMAVASASTTSPNKKLVHNRRLEGKVTEAEYYCTCVCNGDSNYAGVWIAATNSHYDPDGEQGEDADGIVYSYECAPDETIFEYLRYEWEDDIFCDDSCYDDDEDGQE